MSAPPNFGIWRSTGHDVSPIENLTPLGTAEGASVGAAAISGGIAVRG